MPKKKVKPLTEEQVTESWIKVLERDLEVMLIEEVEVSRAEAHLHVRAATASILNDLYKKVREGRDELPYD